LKNSTINLGCNSTCYDVCSRYVESEYFDECLQSEYCNTCFEGIVWVTNSTVNTYEIVEKEYGSLNNLQYKDFKTIS
jgi:hypothetical protein